MIGYISGELISISKDNIILEQNGIGYEIMLTASGLTNLPRIASTVKVYTYLHVREDILALYGFLTCDELNVFKLLITVSGIGPKGAMGILSSLSPDDLRFAVLAEDVKEITKAPGVGVKTAKKLILELKDKFKIDESFEARLIKGENESSPSLGRIKNETIEALLVLGYSRTEASNALKNITINDDTSVEEILKQSLKYLL